MRKTWDRGNQKENNGTHDQYLSANESCGRGNMLCLEPQEPESSHEFSDGLSIDIVPAVYKPGVVDAIVEVVVSPTLGLQRTHWLDCDAHLAAQMECWLPISEGEL